MNDIRSWCAALSRGARMYRESQGWSVWEAAARTGLSRTTIRRFEHSCETARLDTARAVSAVYGGSLDRLAALGADASPDENPTTVTLEASR